MVALHLPMHTATRLAIPVVTAIRRQRPDLPICAYGLYAPLNRDQLAAAGVTATLGPEAEADLVVLARQAHAGQRLAPPAGPALPRLAFQVPDRAGLPALDAYAKLRRPDGRLAVVGATEATRGCKHRCRHCPIVPVYDGQFRVVPAEVVLDDVRAQVRAGAEHITFGDPDFLNGPTHAPPDRRGAVTREWPALTYDVTIKVEHLRAHDALLPRAARYRVRVRDHRRRVVRRCGAGAARQGPHPRRRQRRWSRDAATSAWCCRRPSSRSRRGRRSTASPGSSTRSSASTWSSTLPRCS